MKAKAYAFENTVVTVAVAGFWCALLALMANNCGGATSDFTVEDQTSVHDIELGALRIYQTADGGPASVFSRADYCAAEGMLRRHDAGHLRVDSKGLIDCPKQGRQ